MGKFSLMAVSLVAAIPAGILSTLLVIAFLNHAGAMNVPFYILTGGSLALFAVITLMPVGILVFGAKQEPTAKAGAKTSAEMDQLAAGSAEISVAPVTGEIDVIDAEMSADDFAVADADALDEVHTGEIEVADSDTFDVADTGEVEVADSGDFDIDAFEDDAKKA